jgi:MinD superfamily P-loop ATPase
MSTERLGSITLNKYILDARMPPLCDRRNCNGCCHCEHADRLHEKECEASRGGNIGESKGEVNRRLTDPSTQNGSSQHVKEEAVRTCRRGAKDYRGKDWQVLDAVHVSPHGSLIPFTTLR